MKLKQFTSVILVGLSVLTLSACSMNKHGAYHNAGLTETDGASAAGIGENESFGPAGGVYSSDVASSKNTYYFDYDRSDVRSSDIPKIMGHANYLLNNPNKRIIIEGHTDPRGSREYNVALAERRANAVAEILKSKGVNSAQIRVVSYGAERLAAPGRTEQDFQLDRRAIIVYQR